MEASPAAGRPLQQEQAFEQLYNEHARAIYQYALALLANPSDAEDVTQTTFLNAYRAFQRGERPHKPQNWLISIAHNVCRMRWRQAKARPREVALDEAPELVAHEHERPNLDEVLTALAALSFNQRAALVMRELEGRSYQEMADVLGLSVSAVEALIFRARRRLRVERKALGVISGVPLPGSLTSFLGGGGGGAVATGGAALGANLVLKAAVVVAAGVVTAGVGYRSVDALTGGALSGGQRYVQVVALKQHRATGAVRHAGATRPPARQMKRRAAPAAKATRPGGQPAPPSVQPSAPAQQSSRAVPSSVMSPTAALPQLPSTTLPSLPPAPSVSVPTPRVPQLPVPAPQPPVPAPQLPVTVPTPALPPPPPLPPLLPK
jgi:RNA polymerase sigma-70 factor, ECF subfamily